MTRDVAARLLSWPAPMSVAQARQRIGQGIAALAAGTGADLVIRRHSDGRLIGWIGASLVDAPRRLGAIGYWLPWLVDRLDLAAVEASVQERNFASQAILEGLGFQIKARRRLFSPTRGAPEDAIVFAVPSARLTLSPSLAPERRAYAMR